MNLSRLQKVLWGLVVISAIASGLLLLGEARRDEDQEASAGQGFRARFELTDHMGVLRSEKDYSGRWMLVFFGYANCPDVCPMTLSEVSAAMAGLGDAAPSVQPLFISIDPGRDTPMVLAEFVEVFDAGIIGLSGTPDQISRTADSFHVFYEQANTSEDATDYAMSHSSQLFLFDPQAVFVTSWQYGTPAEDILAELGGYLEQ